MSATNETGISVATFNVHGVRGKEPEVASLAAKVHVLGVCETWIRPNEPSLLRQFSESVSVTQSHSGWRGHGGVAIVVNPLLKYTVLRKIAKTEYQCIVVKVGETCIASLYITPNVEKRSFVEYLDMVTYCVGRKAVIMGDFNTRHTSWDRN